MLLDSMARPADWPAAVYDVPLAQAMHDIGAGRRKWPSNPEKKRHHFVPRFILDSYATSDGGATRRLVQLDKTTGGALKVRPEEAASRQRFYAVESDESPRDNRIEDFLSLVEGYAADPIRTLLERTMELTEADRTTIALMLALQERRTPFGIAQAGKAVEQFGREQMAALAHDPRAFAEMWRKSAPDRSSPADIEMARLEVLAIATEGRLHLRNQREQGLLTMMDGWLLAAETLDLMHWHLLRPAPGTEFIQNDQGVARPDASMRFFPLAPDACLLVCEGSRSLSIHGSTPQGTIEANLAIYGWAERFIFVRARKALTNTHAAAKRASHHG
jgi:hypothetical protein